MSLSEDEQHRVGEIESLTAAADPRFARRLDRSAAAATAAASGRCGGVARTHQRRWYRLRRRPVSVAGRRARQHPLSQFFVLQLLCVEIHHSARRHRVADDDIEYAYDHATVWVELGDDPLRYLMVGPDRSGNMLELVVIRTVELDELVIHAMALRRSTEREVFGRESR